MIIGGNGIIGSKFVDNFKEKEVEFFSTFFQNSSTDDQGIFLDIRDEDNVEKTITKIQPDVIIHTSALAVVDKCETDRELAYSINVKGTENILKVCAENSISSIIHVSQLMCVLELLTNTNTNLRFYIGAYRIFSKTVNFLIPRSK